MRSVLSFLIAVLSLLAVVPIHAENPPTFLGKLDLSEVPGGAFVPVWSEAVDALGNVYVPDGTVRRIVKFARSGLYLTQWGSYGTNNGQFSYPSGIATDTSNNVFVVDEGNARVEKFDSNGTYLAQWRTPGNTNGLPPDPFGIAIDSGQHAYVTDRYNDLIEKFDSNGTFLAQWENGDIHSQGTEGIAIDSSNNVYVASPGHPLARVVKLDSNGTLLTQWGTFGTNNGQFDGPIGIAVDRSNNVYVADSGNSRIQKFDSNGAYLSQWGSFGTNNGQLIYPGGVAVDGSRNMVYVIDTNIHIFAYNTNVIPPIVTSAPVSQTVPVGVDVTFVVGIAGTAPFTYQWASNNVNLLSATNSLITFTNVGLSYNGTYSVVVTNNLGSVELSSVLAVVPAVITTQAVSGITATGAVLNASVTVGPAETIVWFEWGVDTNYGSIAGVTVIPGGSGTGTFTNALSGLDGNLVYHYRVVTWNNFGIVYGADQPFEVGLRPAVVSLFVTSVTTNSATLNAVINPEGRDTTVFFILGTNATTSVPIGSGSVAVPISRWISGLNELQVYNYGVVASNSSGANWRYGSFRPLFWQSSAGAPQGVNWQSIACSADGNHLVAAYAAGIYTSADAGLSWSANSPVGSWSSLACSADGSKLVSAAGGLFSWQSPDGIYVSTNSGLLWTQTSAPHALWSCVASSADGTRLAAGATKGGIWTSADSGATWISNSVPTTNWISIACSADGNILVAAVHGGLIYTSTNAGTTWRASNVPVANWQAAASSADGNKLIAAVGGYGVDVNHVLSGPMFTSTNAGGTWLLQANTPSQAWFSVASSADGSKLVAGAYGNSLFTSSDAGATWVAADFSLGTWQSVASSADGGRLAAVQTGVGGGSGSIYTFQMTPAPLLNITQTAGNLALSWTIPSMDFGLQQNTDLTTTNWVDMGTPPALNLTNLQNELLLDLPAGNSFYRLKH